MNAPTMSDRWQPSESPFAGIPGYPDVEPTLFNLDGIGWWKARIPRSWHHCTPQTWAPTENVVRCACGAIAFTDEGPLYWMERNRRSRKSWWRR